MLLCVGQDIVIESIKSGAGIHAEVVRSETQKHVLKVSLESTVPAFVREGNEVLVRFASKTGRHEARCRVIRVGEEEGVVIGPFEGLRTQQRRQHFRVSAYLPLEVTVAVSGRTIPGTVDKEGVSIDISGGGMLLETVMPFELGDRANVMLKVPDSVPDTVPRRLTAELGVLRVDRVVRAGRELYRLACRFSFSRAADQDQWVKLCLELQRAAVRNLQGS